MQGQLATSLVEVVGDVEPACWMVDEWEDESEVCGWQRALVARRRRAAEQNAARHNQQPQQLFLQPQQVPPPAPLHPPLQPSLHPLQPFQPGCFVQAPPAAQPICSQPLPTYFSGDAVKRQRWS